MDEIPTAPHGEHNGPCESPTPATVPPAHNVFTGAPAAIQAHLTGEPDTLPLTWCKKCEAEVKPEGKGVCPRCHTFLSRNFTARKHPVNKLRRQQLLDKFVRDYCPNTQRLQSMCEQFAGVVEQLEVIKPGSPEHQRLVQLSQTLGAALEEAQLSREARAPSDAPGIASMPSSALHLAQEFLKRQVAGETLTDFEQGALAVLHRAMDGTVLLPPDPRAPEPAHVAPDAGYPKQEATDAPTIDEPTAAPAEPEPACLYGCGSRCAELREKRPDVWHVFHYLDPEEVARREADERERALDERDAQQFLETGFASSRMREKGEARKPKMTDEQKRQAEKRRELGWAEGVLNETTGVYRRHE